MAARIVASALLVGLAALSACATTNEPARGSQGTTETSSATLHRQCLAVDAVCANHFECCSGRCDNGACVRTEP